MEDLESSAVSGSRINNESVEDNHEDSQGVENKKSESEKKKRSSIWLHFKDFVGDNDEKYAECAYCQKKYKTSGKSNCSTGNLSRHLQRKHHEKMTSEAVSERVAFIFSQDKFKMDQSA
ncbi:hypothetical protein Bhyg_06379 [Pseudolycoriella hygida]|uniref:BED-type domain-containing protein n=1 Tax=Pseudolycoriella hygida TaxID=35572 RepID=A0A9Q0S2S4_9DIPT|nr:hypothetical protein Bhyg_06379 [Pseudolycoriella hygida]